MVNHHYIKLKNCYELTHHVAQMVMVTRVDCPITFFFQERLFNLNLTSPNLFSCHKGVTHKYNNLANPGVTLANFCLRGHYQRTKDRKKVFKNELRLCMAKITLPTSSRQYKYMIWTKKFIIHLNHIPTYVQY